MPLPAPGICRLLAAAREVADGDELPPKARKALGELSANFARWTENSRILPHTELAEMVLDESGYTDMLKADKSAEAPERLDNSKEFVRSMESFESLAGFLEHVSLVMEIAQDESGDRINLMTLHACQRAGIRHRVSAGLGGRPVPQSAHHGRKADWRGWRKNARCRSCMSG